MVALLAASALMIVVCGAEWLHHRRCRRIGALAFGPSQRPSLWARAAPVLRVSALGTLCWASVTLLQLPPKIHQTDEPSETDARHVVLVLDVSPSMRLEDAGPAGQLSRMRRASELMESFFKRVAIQQYRLSVVAVYNGAKPVVIDTNDVDVVRNILNDLPMHHAFPAGKTNIFEGLDAAMDIARSWRPKSTNLILLSDGDTVPATGMPDLPASINKVVVVGVGDPVTGRFIDGRQSRQDTSTLRQLAVRLRGTYHNGNEHHLSTSLIGQMASEAGRGAWQRLSVREYALICLGLSGFVFGALPVALHFWGTRWRPGVRRPQAARMGRGGGNTGRRGRVAVGGAS
jgi:Ca-activated chloride channel family protein